MKQPILVLLGRNNRNQNNNEASNLFSATVQSRAFKQPKATQQQREGPVRPVSLFTHPVQQPAQPGSVLTPGTLLKMSGGNSGKKLTILSPNTVDSVFASDEGRAEKPKQSFARPNFQSSKEAGGITEIEIPGRGDVASDKFSPSCFLRSPHFTTKTSSAKKESLTSPMDHQASDPDNNLQQVDLGLLTSNSAGGYGVGSYHQGSLQHNLNQSASFTHSQPSDQSGSAEMSEELSDWLDMSNVLPPCEMEALQKELELGSPMNVDPFQM